MHRDHDRRGPSWLRPDRHVGERVAYYRPGWDRTRHHYGPRVVVHGSYYCGACNTRYQRESRFHRHLRERHRLMHRIHKHLVRWYGGWAYFG